jgi:NitT/TauT family transport system permease protein
MVDLGLLAKFIVDAGYSWVRMFIALGLSIAVSIVVGTWAATSTRAEKIILPITDILQTVPILAFFPLVLAIFVVYLPGYIGINAAVIFLIITSMLWNIIFGVSKLRICTV